MKISGNAFLISKEGNASPLKMNDSLSDFSEIVTDDGATVSFMDHFDHVFHLAPGSQATILNKIVELKSGKIWVQSFSSMNGYSVQTSNAVSSFNEGEFIMAYDSSKMNSQVMVIAGVVKFSNILEDHLFYEISSGNFSFINQDFDKGFPRSPTMIGQDSYHQIVGLFGDVKPINKSLSGMMAQNTVDQTTVSRNIASVDTEVHVQSGRTNELPKDSKIIFVRAKETIRLPASSDVSGGVYLKYMKDSIAAEKKPKVFKGEKVDIRVFGDSFKDSKPTAEVKPEVIKERAPSSIVKVEPKVEHKVVIKFDEKDEFEKSLVKEYADQKRHSNEMNSLIDELKSFSQDFKKSY